jgi:hypothetical protein
MSANSNVQTSSKLTDKYRVFDGRKTLHSFDAEDIDSARVECRKAAHLHLSRIDGKTRLAFEKFNVMIKDWVEFGELQGGRL